MASNVNCLGSDPPTSNLSELCSENINSKILLSPSENMQVETVGSINRNSDDIAVYKEKDHLYCLAENLKAFREANILCDVEINLGREQILAHKCVLAACSKKLKMMLSGDEHQHSRHSVDLSAEPSLFLNLLDYLYTGSLSICIDSIGELLNLAKYLEIENVCHLCCRHLEEVVNVENWSVIFDLATSLDLDSVKKSINTFASHHFLYLSSTDSFKDKDYKHFKSIVTHCNPDNDSELEICKIKEILNWINFDESRLVYLKEFLMLTDVQHIQDIAALVRYIDAIDLRQNVVNHTVFKEFIEGIERVKSLPKTLERSSDNEVNTYAPVVISPKIKNLHPVESNTKKEHDTNDHATDAHHDSDATVEDYGGISDMDSMTKIKEINPNVPELDEVLEQKNKRKSFRPKRLRSVKQLKLKRSESTNRKRGRPRKTLVTEMRQRKPKMKTSCTQVLAENITEEFEEIEREAREQVEHSDLETAEGDENGIPKLETVDNIVKVEPQAPEDVVRKLRSSKNYKRLVSKSATAIRSAINIRIDSCSENKRLSLVKHSPDAEEVFHSHGDKYDKMVQASNEKESQVDSEECFEGTHDTIRTNLPDHPENTNKHVSQKRKSKMQKRRENTKSKQWKASSGIELGITTPEKGQPFICPEQGCNFSSKFKGSFLRHKQTMHDKTHVRCKLCGAIVKPSEMEDHQRVHHSKPIQCELCTKEVRTASELRMHMLANHTDPQTFKYECQHCKKRFHHKSNFEGHMDSHNDIKSWLCQKCCKGFSFRSSLLRHIKVCKGKQPKKKSYPCGLCGLVFKLKDYLNQHITGKHSGELNYPCVCGRTFAWRGSLVNHKKTCAEVMRQKLKEPQTPLSSSPTKPIRNQRQDIMPEEELPPPGHDEILYSNATDPEAILKEMELTLDQMPQNAQQQSFNSSIHQVEGMPRIENSYSESISKRLFSNAVESGPGPKGKNISTEKKLSGSISQYPYVIISEQSSATQMLAPVVQSNYAALASSTIHTELQPVPVTMLNPDEKSVLNLQGTLTQMPQLTEATFSDMTNVTQPGQAIIMSKVSSDARQGSSKNMAGMMYYEHGTGTVEKGTHLDPQRSALMVTDMRLKHEDAPQQILDSSLFQHQVLSVPTSNMSQAMVFSSNENEMKANKFFAL